MRFVFSDCILDPERRELTRASTPIAVGPQVFDLVMYLLLNRERVVSKDDLLDAVWGGRIVSESTLTSHINAARKAIGDSGEEQRLIRTMSRKGYRFVGDVMETSPPGLRQGDASPDTQALKLPDKPSIATLPFQNLSGDPEQDYFAEGVVEDIIAALSRFNWLFVIDRNSSFAYKGHAVDVKQVGRELGVHYILEGSLRKVASRVRITGQLIDASTGGHLWAERFQGNLDDIFELQDEFAASVVGAIAPHLERAEIERSKRKPTESLHAYDYYLRGMTNFHQGTREGVSAALPMFYKATEADPGFASAFGMAAWCYVWRKVNGWMEDRSREYAEAFRLANLAVELDRSDAAALTRGGHALGHFGEDIDGSIALLDRALVLNPNLSAAWYLSGFQRITIGQPDEAAERIARAMRLSPLDPEMARMQTGMAMAHMFSQRFDDAVSWAERAFRELPSFPLSIGIAAASHALSGRLAEGKEALQTLRTLDPDLRGSSLGDWVLLQRAEDMKLFADGLRRAGLPE